MTTYLTMDPWIPRYPLWYFWRRSQGTSWVLVDAGGLSAARNQWDALSGNSNIQLSGRP
jgi:hypothetical protein